MKQIALQQFLPLGFGQGAEDIAVKSTDRKAASASQKKPAALGKRGSEAVSNIAKHHLFFDSLDTKNSHEDFQEIGRSALKNALHAAHRTGYMHASGYAPENHSDKTHGSKAEMEAISRKHNHFDDLDDRNSGDDFQEAASWSVKSALEDAYRAGHAKGKSNSSGGGKLAKSHVSAYTRKDGTFVADHHDKRQAKAAASPKSKPAGLGKKGSDAVAGIAKKHLFFDSLDTKNSHEDFQEIGRSALKTALHDAHRTGYLHATGYAPGNHSDKTHGSKAEMEAISKKHNHFDDLDDRNSGDDFQEAASWSVKSALEEAYRMGHSKGKAAMK